MEVIIREALPHDVPRMLDLVKELATFEREPEAVTETIEGMLDAGFGPIPVWFGWVAEWDASLSSLPSPTSHSSPSRPLLGMAICFERYSTWKGRSLYLEDIVVTAEARGQGIGEKLFRRCVEHGVQKGYGWMRWQVLDWNRDAIRFYEKLGAEVTAGWLNGDLSPRQMRDLVGR